MGRFDQWHISSIVEKAKNMNSAELYQFLLSEAKEMNITPSSTLYEVKDMVLAYKNFAKDLIFVLNNNSKASSMSDEDYEIAKEIIKNLKQ